MGQKYFINSIIFMGVIGEYAGTIYMQVKKRPLVVKKRVNF